MANRMEVLEPPVWDFSPAWSGLLLLWRDLIRSLPFFFFGLLILTLSAGAGVLATRGARTFLHRKVRANLLRNVMARGMGVMVFLFGVYIILRVSGLTQLALTVVGGTGLIGLAVGIGYDDSINEAQEIARNVLADHPAVLNDPEPSVLVDSLGKSTINLRVYLWLNGREHSWLKVRSSVIRLVKLAFQKHGISMPDEAREIVFPHGIPVTVLDGKLADAHGAMPEKGLPPESRHEELAAVSTKAEAGLYSEAVVIEEQARQAQPLKSVENLLPAASGTHASEIQTKEPVPEQKNS